MKELRYKRHMSAEAAYLHGTSPAEQGRLSLLNRLMNDAAMRELAIHPGDLIVDFGCGLAQLSLDLARAAGTRLVAIEHRVLGVNNPVLVPWQTWAVHSQRRPSRTLSSFLSHLEDILKLNMEGLRKLER